MSKLSIEDVLSRAKVPVRAVQICLDADLQAEHDELNAQLEVLNRETRNSLAQGSEAREIANRVTEIEQQMRDSEVTFKFRGLGKNELKRIMDRFPPPDPNPHRVLWDLEEGAYALLAASAVEPVMSEDQAKKLIDTVSQGHTDRMVGAAWLASTGSTQVPFSARASAMTGGTDSN